VVVGGGIAGVSIACRLSIDGVRVILVDDGNIGSGETGRTTAHLVSALDDRYYDLEKTFGKDGASLAAKSHSSAIKYVSKMVEDYHIDCEFEYVPDIYFSIRVIKKNHLKKNIWRQRKRAYR
jgi:glycine/D-amino acid oxidase-like deaminating enzyme